jgi:hypothetical protein
MTRSPVERAPEPGDDALIGNKHALCEVLQIRSDDDLSMAVMQLAADGFSELSVDVENDTLTISGEDGTCEAIEFPFTVGRLRDVVDSVDVEGEARVRYRCLAEEIAEIECLEPSAFVIVADPTWQGSPAPGAPVRYETALQVVIQWVIESYPFTEPIADQTTFGQWLSQRFHPRYAGLDVLDGSLVAIDRRTTFGELRGHAETPNN